MSNRLESLTPKKNNGKPSLKFKPKVVERKSKEERDKTIKVKEEPSKPSRTFSKGAKPRSRDNYAGTHVLSSGLFSSGTVSSGMSSSGFNKSPQTFQSEESSQTGDFIRKLKLKQTNDNVDQEDLTKINMSQEYKFAEEETILFPLRPQRMDHNVTEAVDGITIKQEKPQETELQEILQNKADLETKVNQLADTFDIQEKQKLINDYETTFETINHKFNTNDFTLFQIPKVLPDYLNGTQYLNDAPNPFASDVQQVCGQIGTLNIHKSGKISLNLGNDINLNVTSGAPAHFLQELIILNMKNDEIKQEHDDIEEQPQGIIHKLGVVDDKLVATPMI